MRKCDFSRGIMYQKSQSFKKRKEYSIIMRKIDMRVEELLLRTCRVFYSNIKYRNIVSYIGAI